MSSGALDAVLFIDDVARELRCSRRTIENLRRFDSFPIPELPSIDKRPRWSRVAVDRYLARERTPKRSRSPLKLASR